MNKIKNRPVYLNLFEIRMPVMAVVSILHRVSGLILAFSLPFLIYLFELSLRSETGFDEVQALLNVPLVKYVGIIVTWLMCHHLCAGIRFLLIDIDVGVLKPAAIRGAWMVHVCAIFLTVFLIGMMQ